MTSEYKKFRRESGMAKFEKECSCEMDEGRMRKKYFIPGTQENGKRAMFLAEANRKCKKLYNN